MKTVKYYFGVFKMTFYQGNVWWKLLITLEQVLWLTLFLKAISFSDVLFPTSKAMAIFVLSEIKQPLLTIDVSCENVLPHLHLYLCTFKYKIVLKFDIPGGKTFPSR